VVWGRSGGLSGGCSGGWSGGWSGGGLGGGLEGGLRPCDEEAKRSEDETSGAQAKLMHKAGVGGRREAEGGRW
jgi:hypothetical protein